MIEAPSVLDGAPLGDLRERFLKFAAIYYSAKPTWSAEQISDLATRCFRATCEIVDGAWASKDWYTLASGRRLPLGR